MNPSCICRGYPSAVLIAALAACGGDTREGPRDAGSSDTGSVVDAGVADTGPTTSGNSLIDRARAAGLTALVAAVEQTPALFDRLADDDDDLTLLAPSDEAFASANLPSDPYDLETWLLHHVVPGSQDRADLFANPTLETAARTWVQVDSGAQTVAGASVVAGEGTSASNGTLFVLDGVVALPTIEETMDRDPDMLSLLVWVGAASPSVKMGFSGDGPLTLLAPTNSAAQAFDFINLTQNDIDTALRSVTLSASYPSTDLANGAEVTSGEGPVTVSVDGSEVRFTDESGRMVTVVEADIRAKNGVIHRVDGFLWEK